MYASVSRVRHSWKKTSHFRRVLNHTFYQLHLCTAITRYHNIAVCLQHAVKSFGRRDTLSAAIAFASVEANSEYANVVAERRAEKLSWGSANSRDKVTAGSTLQSLLLHHQHHHHHPRLPTPSCLAQMKFSATLHSNTIKARILSWYPAQENGESKTETPPHLFFLHSPPLYSIYPPHLPPSIRDLWVSSFFVDFKKSNCNL